MTDVAPTAPPAVEPLGESRWPPVATLAVFIAITVTVRLWLPGGGPYRVHWLVPAVETLVLVAVLVGDPGNVAKPKRLHRVSVALVLLLVAAALWATGILVYDLIKGIGDANEPDELLASGALVWLGNNLAFGLFYWLVDGGGPIARSTLLAPVDFAFPQDMNPEITPPGWHATFLDYLYLGFTNSTAFSPTDVMPLTHRAKAAMVVQSTAALLLFGLIVARAVNAFT